MTRTRPPPVTPEVWAGVECSYLQVAGRTVDQLTATGHRYRASDMDLLAQLAPSAVRYPILWGWPDGGLETDWEWAADRLGRLARAGIMPIVGLLHHGYGPTASSALDDEFATAFGKYAGKVARRFPNVQTYLPMNEPLTTARFGGLYAWWPPHMATAEAFTRLIVNQCMAIRAAAREIKKVRPDATVIVNEDGGKTYGTAAVREQIEWENVRRWLTFDLLTGRVTPAHPLWPHLYSVRSLRRALDSLRDDPEPPAILGLDYYVTSDRWLDDRIALYPSAVRGGNGRFAYADVELARVEGESIDGFGRCLRETWERYGTPVALMEVDLAGEDVDKLAWWMEAWSAACDAAASGVPVAAVTAWSVFGAFDWSTVLRRADGAYEPGAFDIRYSPPRETRLGALIAATSKKLAAHPYRPLGWWRRDDRVLFRPPPRVRRSGKGGAEKPQGVAAHHPVDRRARQAGVQQGIAKSR